MSTVAAMASSSLNPNAPLFIPAAYRQVEDFSPEWWELVNTTAWFRDHWFRQHQLHEAACDAAALLPDDSIDLLDTDDLFHQVAKPAPAPALLPGYDLDVLRALSLSSPRAAAVAARPAAAEVRGQAGVPRRRQGRRPPRHPPASLEEERFFSCCHHGCCA